MSMGTDDRNASHQSRSYHFLAQSFHHRGGEKLDGNLILINQSSRRPHFHYRQLNYRLTPRLLMTSLDPSSAPSFTSSALPSVGSYSIPPGAPSPDMF